MKIIATDNYNRDHIADFLVCENVKENFVKHIVEGLNALELANWFFRAVPDDYRLSRGMEDLI